MKHSPLLLVLLLLLILQTTACGLGPQPTNMPTLTSTPAPALQTSSHPTIIPKSTNMPASANTPESIVLVERDPDTVWHPHKVTLMGPLEISIPGRNATAGQGWLELTIRPDGEAIVFLRYSLLRANCYTDSGTILHENYGWTFSAPLPEPAFIVNDLFEFNYAGELKVSGQINSPTEAIAMVEISTEGWKTKEGSLMCNFGTWIWRGEVK